MLIAPQCKRNEQCGKLIPRLRLGMTGLAWSPTEAAPMRLLATFSGDRRVGEILHFVPVNMANKAQPLVSASAIHAGARRCRRPAASRYS
jgi:hypothetical protein